MIDDPAEPLPRGTADEAGAEREAVAEDRRAEGSGRDEVPFHIPRD